MSTELAGLIAEWERLHNALPRYESLTGVTKHGLMSKRAPGVALRRWRARHFVLKGHFLYYFSDSPTGKSAKGVLLLAGAAIAENIDMARSEGRPFVIGITLAHSRRPTRTDDASRTVYVSPDTENSYREWLAALGQAARVAAPPAVAAAAAAAGQAPPSWPPGTKDDYELLKLIGKGSFGKVFLVRRKDDGKIYAMKTLSKNTIVQRKQEAHTRSERLILEQVEHPFIVNLRYAFQDTKNLYLVMDYAAGGELFFHLKTDQRFPEERARLYIAEITMAIETLHNHGVVYRDLKPENILIDGEGHVRITDFGLSKEEVRDGTTHTFCGTPEYLAPEMLTGQGHGKAVDWWSLGTLLFEMLTGLPPFYSSNVHVMYEKILKDPIVFPPHISPVARDFLQALLTRDPEHRLGSGPGGGADVRAHPFFASLDWEMVYHRRIDPSFRPTKFGSCDTQYFDTTFTSEAPQITPSTPSTLDVFPVENFDFNHQQRSNQA